MGYAFGNKRKGWGNDENNEKTAVCLLCAAAGFGCASGGLLFCVLNEWAAGEFFPYSECASYYPLHLLYDRLIDNEIALWVMSDALVGYPLALVCAGQYKKRALAYGVERLVKTARKDDSFRIPPIGKWLISLPYFAAASAAAVSFIEML